LRETEQSAGLRVQFKEPKHTCNRWLGDQLWSRPQEMKECFMKKTLSTTLAAGALLAGIGIAAAQTQNNPPSSVQQQPNTQMRDQSGTPGTGQSTMSPGDPRTPRGATSGSGGAMGQGAGNDRGGAVQPAPGMRDSDGNKGTGSSTPGSADAPASR
jgi:hypothetical protein